MLPPQSPLHIRKVGCRAKGTGHAACAGGVSSAGPRGAYLLPPVAAAGDLHMAGLALHAPLGKEVGRRRVAEGEYCHGQDADACD